MSKPSAPKNFIPPTRRNGKNTIATKAMPRPPNQFSMPRQSTKPGGKVSSFGTTETPVVVIPETASNIAFGEAPDAVRQAGTAGRCEAGDCDPDRRRHEEGLTDRELRRRAVGGCQGQQPAGQCLSAAPDSKNTVQLEWPAARSSRRRHQHGGANEDQDQADHMQRWTGIEHRGGYPCRRCRPTASALDRPAGSKGAMAETPERRKERRRNRITRSGSGSRHRAR